jgi:hypothetical protein
MYRRKASACDRQIRFSGNTGRIDSDGSVAEQQCTPAARGSAKIQEAYSSTAIIKARIDHCSLPSTSDCLR